MLGWFQSLMPKEERFFELFSRHGDVVLAGAEALERPQRRDKVENDCRVIFERKAKADEITHQVLIMVCCVFLRARSRLRFSIY
jgi:uncharacterized protein Yka (UPF0111/DUF47 family)